MPARDVTAETTSAVAAAAVSAVRHKSDRVHIDTIEYEYESGFRFTARRSFNRTSAAFTVTCTGK